MTGRSCPRPRMIFASRRARRTRATARSESPRQALRLAAGALLVGCASGGRQVGVPHRVGVEPSVDRAPTPSSKPAASSSAPACPVAPASPAAPVPPLWVQQERELIFGRDNEPRIMGTRRSSAGERVMPAPEWSAPRALWATNGEARVATENDLFHFRAGAWRREPVPVVEPAAFWGLRPDSIWVVGKGGAAHIDCQSWRSLAMGSFSAVAGRADDELWFGGDAGLFRVQAVPP